MVLSFGEKAVGVSFNPSGDDAVTQCKLDFANLIDHLHNARVKSENADVIRMFSVAITECQTAQMWAVKALTWKE
jgi:hypothetical protein